MGSWEHTKATLKCCHALHVRYSYAGDCLQSWYLSSLYNYNTEQATSKKMKRNAASEGGVWLSIRRGDVNIQQQFPPPTNDNSNKKTETKNKNENNNTKQQQQQHPPPHTHTPTHTHKQTNKQTKQKTTKQTQTQKQSHNQTSRRIRCICQCTVTYLYRDELYWTNLEYISIYAHFTRGVI